MNGGCEYISENLEEVRGRIAGAAKRAGRTDLPTLIAVTKTVETDMVNALVSLGVTELGENRVQELMEKMERVNGANWHLIGRLQTNKVKYVVGKVKLIHSLDSEKLAEEISKRALKLGIVQDVLIEINIGAEESKTGVSPGEAINFREKLSAYEGIRPAGLMCVAPFVENQEENRALFRKMKQLFIDINKKNIDNMVMEHLSMGMTNDYEVAVEEGATMVRIGTGIFGARVK